MGSAYHNATIFYLSGTGNSYRVAAWMHQAAEDNGLKSQLLPINGEVAPAARLQAGPTQLLGLLLPTHGFTAPWLMIRFALRLPAGRGNHAFVTPTRAGIRIGCFLPGMEGTAGYLLALILLLKGYVLRGVMGIDMPSNWMSLHWGLSMANSQAIIERAYRKTNLFFNSLLNGKSQIRGWIPLLLGILLLPISVVYLLMGRFFLAKLFFANSDCNGCGLCAKNCPTGSLTMRGKNQPRPYWSLSCESCMRCMGYCPQQAVEAGHSFGIILYYLTTIPAAYVLIKALTDRVPQLMPIKSQWVEVPLDYLGFIIVLWFAYLIFNYLIRVPLINKLFTYTTMTHYYRRYHEPATRLKELNGDLSDTSDKL